MHINHVVDIGAWIGRYLGRIYLAEYKVYACTQYVYIYTYTHYVVTRTIPGSDQLPPEQVTSNSDLAYLDRPDYRHR